MDECRMPHRFVLKADWTEPPQDAGLNRQNAADIGWNEVREEPGGALPKGPMPRLGGHDLTQLVHAAVIDACQVPEPP
jgi:hypothetical protein